MPVLRILHKHGFFAGLTVLIVLLAVAGPPLSQQLLYSRKAVLAGEWWRLLTGHLVHLGPAHLLLNLGGLTLIWLAFGTRFSLSDWTVIALIVLAGTGLGLFFFNFDIHYGAGLSGALHGLFAAGALAEARYGSRISYLLLLLFIAKLIWEQVYSPLFGATLLTGRIGVDAHLYGAVSGLFAFVLAELADRR